jgi:hypothetical protein
VTVFVDQSGIGQRLGEGDGSPAGAVAGGFSAAECGSGIYRSRGGVVVKRLSEKGITRKLDADFFHGRAQAPPREALTASPKR